MRPGIFLDDDISSRVRYSMTLISTPIPETSEKSATVMPSISTRKLNARYGSLRAVLGTDPPFPAVGQAAGRAGHGRRGSTLSQLTPEACPTPATPGPIRHPPCEAPRPRAAGAA